MKHRPQFSSTEREMQPKKAPDVHWNKCFRYKEDLAENLRCPLNAKVTMHKKATLVFCPENPKVQML